MLIQLLRDGARVVADQPVVLTGHRSVSYAACVAHSEDLARGIVARSWDRFACQVTDPAALVALLCASTAVGSEACVYPAWAPAPKVDELAVRFNHRWVVSDSALALHGTAAVALDAVPLPGPLRSLPPLPAQTPTLILTTGTTGAPKGVRHDWGRLAAARPSRETPPGERWLLAYNLNQFAGVQMLLHVLATKATLVAFSGQPRDALHAMVEHQVTHASATPTFWRLLTGLLDERSAQKLALRQITLGGEAIPGPLLAHLRRCFPEAHISQVYAATEFGSGVSVRDGLNGLPARVLLRDETNPVQMKIIDGELYTRSRVGMLGYYGEPDVTENDWRATGDLVELRGDRIYFVGRGTEMINVGGVKVHPLPIEETVSGLEGVQLARAYGRPSPVTGQIVAVDVVPRPGAGPDALDALKEAIRAACQSLPPAAQPRRIRFVDEVDITEHKVSRRRISGD